MKHLKRIGSRILSEANDLKRTPDVLARELGLSNKLIHLVIAGNASFDEVLRVVYSISQRYPVSFSDLWEDSNDTDDGVIIVSAQQSMKSARVFDRADKLGEKTPYYEYRDTAMSRMGPFKPEWIKELRVVEDNDPNNLDVVYNNGHLMHQMTFFVGDVNFYWESNGRKHCVELMTGASNFITPFVPHSFASRNPNRLGVIVAVTFGGQVRRALRDFGQLSVTDAEHLAGDLRAPSAYGVRIRRFMMAESLSEEEVISQLEKAGVESTRARALLIDGCPNFLECECLAEILSVRPTDIMIRTIPSESEVVVRTADDTIPRRYPITGQPSYLMRQLARHPFYPMVKSFDVSVISQDGVTMRHQLHQYVYNYGEVPVRFDWAKGRSFILMPGDSIYCAPMVQHAFSLIEGKEKAHVLVIRVPGAITQEALDEYATFESGRRSRVIKENTIWF